MIKWISSFYLTIVIVLFSCSRKETVPDKIISEEKMGQILIDLSLAEAFVDNFLPRDSTIKKDSLIQIEMDKILVIHKVDEKKFTASYKFYKEHPTLFKVMIDSAYSVTQKMRDSSALKRIPVKL